MLSLVLRGKLAVTEDVLTAVVFDAIAGKRDLTIVRALLDGASGLHGPLALPPFDDMAIELWPRTDAGEPDVRIRLFADGAPVRTVIVEAKLWAAKSGEGVLAGDGDETPHARDQLARYLLDEYRRDPTCVLVYLTHHAIRPDDDLRASIACLERAGGSGLDDRLYWLSWRALERDVARRITDGAPYEGVREVLHRARMFWFNGIALGEPLDLAGTPAFYRSAPVTYRWPTPPSAPSLAWPYRRASVVTAGGAVTGWPGLARTLGTSQFYEERKR